MFRIPHNGIDNDHFARHDCRKHRFLTALYAIVIVMPFLSPPAISAGPINETYYEVTIPSGWFDDYSKERMVSLLRELSKTESHRKIIDDIRRFSKRPKLHVDIYKDDVEEESDSAWVFRFTISTDEIGLKKSQMLVKRIGTSFGKYIERYRK